MTHAFENHTSTVGIIIRVITRFVGVTLASWFISSQGATIIGLICGLASYSGICMLKVHPHILGDDDIPFFLDSPANKESKVSSFKCAIVVEMLHVQNNPSFFF